MPVLEDTFTKRAAVRRVYKCQCGRPVFFRNSVCLACKTPLGYEPSLGLICPLAPGPEPETWTVIGVIGEKDRRLYRHCANLTSPSLCNWLVRADAEDAARQLCISCCLNRTIPDLSIAANGENWRRIEVAKRRLISSLLALGLPVKPQVEGEPDGLAFDFLRSLPEGPPVMTGHADGVITLNIEEADDATREGIREQLHEPYRTLLGHLRHEVGHYYWDRLVAGTKWLDGFRELFGDDREDYQKALQTHYQQGPPADWGAKFVSAYASSHPWEDWAETWAHYLHMTETLDTASSFNLDIESVEMPFEGFKPEVLVQPDEDFLHFINSWSRFTAVLNELSLSMGLPDFYPFVLSKSSVAKLHFVHRVIENQRS